MALILIVDDEADNLSVVDFALRTEGHTVIGVQDPARAVASVEEHKPDLIILDLNLSKNINGVALCRELRAGAAPATPMIAVTAAVLSYNRADVLAAGFNEFISWPISVKDLRELVRRFV